MNYQLISEFIESIKSTNGHPLTKIEENNLCTFIDTLGRENATIVFRGDKSDVFMTSDISELSYKIFMVGPKAASFWKQRSIYLKKNICKSLIVSLYSEFEKAFNLDRIKSPNSKEHIKNFINSEQDFASYFAHENKDDFYNKIKDLHVCEKQFVMDYYNTIQYYIVWAISFIMEAIRYLQQQNWKLQKKFQMTSYMLHGFHKCF